MTHVWENDQLKIKRRRIHLPFAQISRPAGRFSVSFEYLMQWFALNDITKDEHLREFNYSLSATLSRKIENLANAALVDFIEFDCEKQLCALIFELPDSQRLLIIF